MSGKANLRPPRLQDVAEEAGVSIATASRVLSGSTQEPITGQTRAAVLDAARRLRYRPNVMARALKTTETGALGVLVPSLRNPVYASVIRRAFTRAWQRGFVVLLVEEQDGGQEAYDRLVTEGRIDGCMIMTGVPLCGEQGIRGVPDMPHVFVNRRVPNSQRNVSMRDEDAGHVAARHLAELGHVRLAHLAGPEELDTALRRTAGFLTSASLHGCEVVVEHALYEERSAFEVVLRLMQRPNRPTALFASNLTQAIGAMAALRQLKIRVPEDLSVINCDDDVLAEFLDVALTTIRMPLSELGTVAVDALLAQLEGGPPRDHIVETEPELIVRRSTMARTST